ncbi:MFS transporter [Alicyclobacillus macrosporangiidus]|uniref:Predicted arabinose efflux permease, MFS family n=1 Tax=Alicyclobacillus macrosporangiidus TaxID=392015 RepID=A0A1I7GHT2_9BACL|nr:MFS transporter [Alicyclobacillus macrosporangiidus]SFU47975.1 Predicted arabinose efflux permease, MFS family [Alicyclobacillus macrosporangiidus]
MNGWRIVPRRSAADRLRSPDSLWVNRDFVWFISGRTISQFGTAMTTFAIPWLLLERTGSAAQTGLAFAVGFIPYILLSLPAGVWADRRDRRRLMQGADAGRLVLLASIPLSQAFLGHPPLLLLYAAQAGVSALSAIFDAAYGACLPNLVSPNHLPAANNTLQLGSSLSRTVGPVLAGAAAGAMGAANTIGIDVATYGVSILTLLCIRRPFASAPARVRRGFASEVKEGMAVVWHIRPVRYLCLFATLINLVGPGMDVALLYRVQHELRLPSLWAGWVMTGLGAGMLAGSLAYRVLGGRLRSWLSASAAGLVVPPLLLAFIRTPVWMVVVQGAIGVLLTVWNVQSVTLRQTLIPDELRGRCSSVFRLFAWVSIPLGDALAGIVSERWGTGVYFLWACAVLGAMAAWTRRANLELAVDSGGGPAPPVTRTPAAPS